MSFVATPADTSKLSSLIDWADERKRELDTFLEITGNPITNLFRFVFVFHG